MSAWNFSASTAARSMEVNYQGVVHGIDAALPLMLARGEGHIALIGSVAGYRGLPRAAAYGPSKAALINLAEALTMTSRNAALPSASSIRDMSRRR
jgi:short-subunit dehydrogenase